jgi:hypothetical protein
MKSPSRWGGIGRRSTHWWQWQRTSPSFRKKRALEGPEKVNILRTILKISKMTAAELQKHSGICRIVLDSVGFLFMVEVTLKFA